MNKTDGSNVLSGRRCWSLSLLQLPSIFNHMQELLKFNLKNSIFKREKMELIPRMVAHHFQATGVCLERLPNVSEEQKLLKFIPRGVTQCFKLRVVELHHWNDNPTFPSDRKWCLSKTRLPNVFMQQMLALSPVCSPHVFKQEEVAFIPRMVAQRYNTRTVNWHFQARGVRVYAKNGCPVFGGNRSCWSSSLDWIPSVFEQQEFEFITEVVTHCFQATGVEVYPLEYNLRPFI